MRYASAAAFRQALEPQIAEKVHAYTRGYGQSGMASTRVKDLVDLALIASASQVNADRLNRALRETFRQRDRHVRGTRCSLLGARGSRLGGTIEPGQRLRP